METHNLEKMLFGFRIKSCVAVKNATSLTSNYPATITQECGIFLAERLKQTLTSFEILRILTDLILCFDPLSSFTLNKAKQTPESISVNFHAKLQSNKYYVFQTKPLNSLLKDFPLRCNLPTTRSKGWCFVLQSRARRRPATLCIL